jgi:hypothetical protein
MPIRFPSVVDGNPKIQATIQVLLDEELEKLVGTAPYQRVDVATVATAAHL